MSIRTVKVSNISLAAAERDVFEYFFLCGEIQCIEMQSESGISQNAYVTFGESLGAETAMLLTEGMIADQTVSITLVENYKLPGNIRLTSLKEQKSNEVDIGAVKKAEDVETDVVAVKEADQDVEDVETNTGAMKKTNDVAVNKAEDMVSTMLAKGFVLGKDALKKAIDFDRKHQLTQNASTRVASVDRKIGLSEKLSKGTSMINEKVKEIDGRFQVSGKTKTALAAAEHNRLVSTGAAWVTKGFGAVSKAAGGVGSMTKDKVEKAEKKRETLTVKERPPPMITTNADGSPSISIGSPVKNMF